MMRLSASRLLQAEFRVYYFRICAVLLLVVSAGCMVGPDFYRPDAKVEAAWIENGAMSSQPYGAAEIFWWKQFNDPTLNKLVEMAYEDNPDLQSAGVRILQARAQLNGAIGNLFPQQQGINAGTSYNYIPPQNDEGSSSQFNPNTPLGETLASNLGNNLGGMSLGPNLFTNQLIFSANWEIDFWGKYRRQIQADRASFLSSVASYDNVLVTLIGDVANSYINIRTIQEQIRVTQQNVATQKESLRIAQARFDAGETSLLDVEQAKTQLAQTQADIPSLESSLRTTKNGLAIQLGIPPARVDQLIKPGRMPSAPSRVAAGAPHDLLRRRPDVRQAGLDAASQCAKIGVQVANMLPALSLNGSFGYSANNTGNNSLANLFNWENAIVQGASSIVVPVFNYGRLINNVRVQDASFQEALFTYQSTVLNAQKEVEDGLAEYSYGKQEVVFLEEAVTSAEKTTELALVQYKAGETDYTTVLTAEQQQLSVQNSLVTTRGNVLLAVVDVYRALGGGWQMRGGRDVISDETKRQMQDRTRWGRMLEPANHLPRVDPEEDPLPPEPPKRSWFQKLFQRP